LKNAKTEVRFVRTADLELSILLRQVSNGSFAEAAAQRVARRATAAMGRKHQCPGFFTPGFPVISSGNQTSQICSTKALTSG